MMCCVEDPSFFHSMRIWFCQLMKFVMRLLVGMLDRESKCFSLKVIVKGFAASQETLLQMTLPQEATTREHGSGFDSKADTISTCSCPQMLPLWQDLSSIFCWLWRPSSPPYSE